MLYRILVSVITTSVQSLRLIEISLFRALDLDISGLRLDLFLDLPEKLLSLGISGHDASHLPDGRKLRFGDDIQLIRIRRSFRIKVYIRIRVQQGFLTGFGDTWLTMRSIRNVSPLHVLQPGQSEIHTGIPTGDSCPPQPSEYTVVTANPMLAAILRLDNRMLRIAGQNGLLTSCYQPNQELCFICCIS